MLRGSQIQSTDHPECKILKSDAVVNIEMRPEPNSFDLFLEKEPSHPAGFDRHSGYGPELAEISDLFSISWRSLAPSIASLAKEGYAKPRDATSHDTSKEQKTGERTGTQEGN
jgi:hypothetical protein